MADELKVSLNPTCSNSAVKIQDGAADHTYTVLSITICVTNGTAESFDLYVNDDAGGTLYYIYLTQDLPANATFEHTAKIVLEGTDELTFVLDSAGDVDVIVSYLDQT